MTPWAFEFLFTSYGMLYGMFSSYLLGHEHAVADDSYLVQALRQVPAYAQYALVLIVLVLVGTPARVWRELANALERTLRPGAHGFNRRQDDRRQDNSLLALTLRMNAVEEQMRTFVSLTELHKELKKVTTKAKVYTHEICTPIALNHARKGYASFHGMREFDVESKDIVNSSAGVHAWADYYANDNV